jgi:hypothetical protein
MGMKSCNYCTHYKMSGHWIEKCWKLHLELFRTPRKNPIQEPMKLEAWSKWILFNKKKAKNQSA